VGRRNVIAAIFQGGAEAVAALVDGCVGQTDGVEVVLIGLDARAVDLHLNNVGVNALHSDAESLVKHRLCAGMLVPESAHEGLIRESLQ
jgi:hypothetical protein